MKIQILCNPAIPLFGMYIYIIYIKTLFILAIYMIRFTTAVKINYGHIHQSKEYNTTFIKFTEAELNKISFRDSKVILIESG